MFRINRIFCCEECLLVWSGHDRASEIQEIQKSCKSCPIGGSRRGSSWVLVGLRRSLASTLPATSRRLPGEAGQLEPQKPTGL